MNRLKEFLQIEVRKSYKYIISSATTLRTIEYCTNELKLTSLEQSYDDNFFALQILLEETIESMENYLKIDA